MKIEKALNIDALQLTDLTIRSKSYWNYGEKQIEEWREDLTISSDYINEKEVYKLISGDRLIGYYSYFNLNESEVRLDNMFVDPIFIRQGYGKYLMTDFISRIKNDQFKKATLEADPNVEDFYSHMGFYTVGKLKSSIKDRFLPVMEVIINPNE